LRHPTTAIQSASTTPRVAAGTCPRMAVQQYNMVQHNAILTMLQYRATHCAMTSTLGCAVVITELEVGAGAGRGWMGLKLQLDIHRPPPLNSDNSAPCTTKMQPQLLKNTCPTSLQSSGVTLSPPAPPATSGYQAPPTPRQGAALLPPLHSCTTAPSRTCRQPCLRAVQ
jgi:hypothetical protein